MTSNEISKGQTISCLIQLIEHCQLSFDQG